MIKKIDICKLFAGLLALIMIFSLMPMAYAADDSSTSFKDIKGHWAEPIINELVAGGVIYGCGNGFCCPDDIITHSQFAALLARYFDFESESTNTSGYPDITNHWSAKWICGLVDVGVIPAGNGSINFDPDAPITRMGMLYMMVRAIGKEGEVGTSCGSTTFADDDTIATKDSGYINIAQQCGIIEGFPDGTVRPYDEATRAEGFAVLKRFITAVPKISLDFTMPATAHTDTAVHIDLLAENVDGKSITWRIERDGTKVNLSDVAIGYFDDKGGVLQFAKEGTYKITAFVTDRYGKIHSCAKEITIFPVASINLSMPKTTHTDNVVSIKVSGEYIRFLPVTWTARKDGQEIDISEYITGSIGHKGGEVKFTTPGTYVLTAAVTDDGGRSFSSTAKITVYPVGELAFYLPELFHTNETVALETNMKEIDSNSLSWGLTRNGESVNPSDYITGTLGIEGGNIQVTQKGDYVLSATFMDNGGRVYTHEQSFTAYPLPTYQVTSPATVTIGQKFDVVGSGENLEDCSITWATTLAGSPIVLDGKLGNLGGTLSSSKIGIYEFTATVTNQYGDVITAKTTTEVINTEPNAPEISYVIDYLDNKNAYTDKCTVKVNIFAKATDPDGDEVTYEYDAGSAQTGYFGPGTQTIKVRAVDPWGAKSDWVTKSFTISTSEPTVELSSSDLDSQNSTNKTEINIDAVITAENYYMISVTDYYDTEHKIDSIRDIPATTNAATLTSEGSKGQRMAVVQVKDLFGSVNYGTLYFTVGNTTNSGNASITGMSTRVTDNGLSDADGKALAYISDFTFDVPSISGHGSSNCDVITVYGIDENGNKSTVVTFNTSDGYGHVSSDGAYRGSEDSGSFTYEKNKYVKLTFEYIMTSGHEGCLNKVTDGMSYTVNYTFIPGKISDLGSLFED